MSASQYRPRSALRPANEPYEYFGCGWYQSSYELSQGSVVEEDLSLEEFELWVMAANERAAKAATA